MNAHCSNCGVTFEPEPGFYTGAMYVSYVLTLVLFVTISVVLYFLFDNPSDWVYLTAIVVGAVLFTPFSFRYSRILYLHSFGGIHYDPTAV
ncbi:MAG: DUF983 domain-containing protein [Cyclobacteriaceae bacterium]|nr:DUF983 domain-containing protein [Cyclobacteriaceae bacterium]